MADTKRGRLGASILTAATAAAVYETTAAMDALVDVLFVNTGSGHAKIRLAVVDGALADLASNDYILYNHELLQGASFRVSDINMNTSEAIVAYSDKAGVVCRVDGIEEDEAGNSVLPSIQVLSSGLLAVTGFTDNTNATGYIDFPSALPAGAVPLGWKAVISGAFAGDTTAVMQVGIAGDVDRFSADVAQSCFAAGTKGATAIAADACDGIAAASTPRVTVTGGADFTAIKTEAGGEMTVYLYYIATV